MPTVTIQPDPTAGKDTWIESFNLNVNRGDVAAVEIGGSDSRRPMLQFDLSSIPAGAKVTNATLDLTLNSTNQFVQQTVTAHEIRGTWAEMEVTWNNQPTHLTASDGSLSKELVSGDDLWSIPLTPLVDRWVSGSTTNHGVVLKCSGSTVFSFYSSDSNTASRRPALVVTYDQPPAAPGAFTDPTAGEVHGDTVTYTHGAGSDPDGNLTGYDVEYSTDNGQSWTRWASNRASTSGTIDSSGWPATATAKLRARSVDAGGKVSGWTVSPTFEVVHNVAPNAPSNLSPSGGVTIDRDVTQRFTWQFSDPDAGDSQSAYDLRYRLEGTTTWTVVSATSTNSYRDFAAGTFPAGSYEWQVRTADAQGVYGPYSASAFFVAASSPSDLTITEPVNNATISSEDSQVAWSTPSQEAFQVRRVADNAGAPDATTVYYDSGEVLSATARNHALTFETNNRDEHVQVRIRASGLWSAWESVKVTVSYTPPQVPRLETSARGGDGSVRLEVDVPPPPPGLPTFARASTAYLDGVEVASGTPRYPDGTSILVEEGTTNLLTANQASIETDTTGWLAANNATIARSTAQAWHGAASLEVTAVAAGRTNARTDNRAVTAGTTYTLQARARPATTGRTTRVLAVWLDSGGVFVSEVAGDAVVTTVGTWTRVTLTAAAPATAAFVRVYLDVNDAGVAAGEVHYFDGVQVEAKGYATSWHPGGATRNAEQLTVPPATFHPVRTVEMDAVVNSPTTDERPIFDARDLTASSQGDTTVSIAAVSGFIRARVGSYGYLNSTVPVGPEVRRIALRWDTDAGTVALWVDGVERVTAALPAATKLGTTTRVVLGSRIDWAPNNFANARLLGVRFTDRPRTDAELADWTAPLVADDATTYLLRFEGNLEYATGYGEFDGTENYPAVTATRVYRTGPDGTEILLAVTAPEAGYTDRTVAGGAAYTYRVVSVGDNGTTTTSATSPTVTVTLTGVWLHPADDPADHRHYRANAEGGAQRRTVEQALRRYAGRALPVVEYGEGREVEISATLHLTDRASWEFLRGLEGRIVLYRDAAGRRLFGTLRLAEDATFYGRDVDLEVQAVDYDEAVAL